MKAERALVALALAALFSAARAESTWDEVAARLRAASLTQEQVLVIVGQARARGLAPRNLEPWAERMERLAQSDIPPVIAGERLAQGLAKGVPVERLDRALADLDDNLRWLNGFLERTTARAERRNNPGQSELALRAGEAALRAGFDRAQLERTLGPGPLTLEQTIALSQTAGSLRAANVDRGEIVQALEGVGKAGISASEIRQLEQRFVAAAAAGRPARVAFEELKATLGKLVREADEAARGAVQREELRQELRQEMRDTLRAPGGPDMRPGGGVSPAAGRSKGVR